MKFYEQVRVWMAKFDGQERQAAGRPIPDDIKRLLAALVYESTASDGIVDIYEAAGLPKPSLSDLAFAVRPRAGVRSRRQAAARHKSAAVSYNAASSHQPLNSISADAHPRGRAAEKIFCRLSKNGLRTCPMDLLFAQG